MGRDGSFPRFLAMGLVWNTFPSGLPDYQEIAQRIGSMSGIGGSSTGGVIHIIWQEWPS